MPLIISTETVITAMKPEFTIGRTVTPIDMK